VFGDRDRALLESFTGIGLTRTSGFDGGCLTPHARQEVLRGLADGRQVVATKASDLGRSANGWTVNPSGPRFGDDHLLRAAVARDQIYVTVPEEGLYPVTHSDCTGEPLTGRRRYRIRFPTDAMPPARAFWSVTMYDASGYLVPNPANRYAIGDRTRGLVRGPDGSLTLAVQHGAPGEPANWLPSPTGDFYLMLRLFAPDVDAFLQWQPPPVEPVA
jgi:hypothetical protein